MLQWNTHQLLSGQFPSSGHTYCARDCHYCMVGYGHAKYMLEEGVKNGIFTDLGNGKYARILVPPGPRGL
jgi:hypothetical protein